MLRGCDFYASLDGNGGRLVRISLTYFAKYQNLKLIKFITNNYGICEFSKVNANPRKTINSEYINHPNPNLKVQLKGLHDTETDFYYIAVEVTNIPIYQPAATPPAAGETVIPDNDDIEST
jgi:hypothetical protein